MNRRSLKALVVLNAVLLMALSMVTFITPTPAQAQFNRPPMYVMVSGEVTGRNNQAVVYIVELTTSRVAAIIFNGSNNRLEVIAGRVMAADMQ